MDSASSRQKEEEIPTQREMALCPRCVKGQSWLQFPFLAGARGPRSCRGQSTDRKGHQLSWLTVHYLAHLTVLCCLTPEAAPCRPKLLPEPPLQAEFWVQLAIRALLQRSERCLLQGGPAATELPEARLQLESTPAL